MANQTVQGVHDRLSGWKSWHEEMRSIVKEVFPLISCSTSQSLEKYADQIKCV